MTARWSLFVGALAAAVALTGRPTWSQAEPSEVPVVTRQLGSKAELKPFLSVPLESKVRDTVVITEGYDYLQELSLHPSVKRHYAVDFQVRRGTPVLAAADGYAFASYHLVYLEDRFQGKRMGFGLGRFVQIWHPQAGVYTLYAHLGQIDSSVRYHQPVRLDEGWDPAKLYVPVEEFLKLAAPVKRGQRIGTVGTSGLSLLGDGEHPNNVNLPTWDPAGPHLHFEVYTRGANGRGKVLRWDPFGLEQTSPAYKGIFRELATGYFLPDPKTGWPLFADQPL